MKECRLCKTANDDSVAFCRVCGTKFSDTNNQEATIPGAIDYSNELREIKKTLQEIATRQNAKECTLVESNPYSSSESEEFVNIINAHLSQGWIVAGFTCDQSRMRALLTR